MSTFCPLPLISSGGFYKLDIKKIKNCSPKCPLQTVKCHVFTKNVTWPSYCTKFAWMY